MFARHSLAPVSGIMLCCSLCRTREESPRESSMLTSRLPMRPTRDCLQAEGVLVKQEKGHDSNPILVGQSEVELSHLRGSGDPWTAASPIAGLHSSTSATFHSWGLKYSRSGQLHIAMAPQTAQLTPKLASLEDVRIKNLPRSSYYISDFISEDEECALLNKVSRHHLHTSACASR